MNRSTCSPRPRRIRAVALAAALTCAAFVLPVAAGAQDTVLPDEGYVAPPPVEYEHDSLTIDRVQVDPPATTGEVVLGVDDEPQAAATTVAAAGAAAEPRGLLPFTGARTTGVLIAGIALLGAGLAASVLGARASARGMVRPT